MPDPNHILLDDHQIGWFGLCKNANSAIKMAILDSLGQPVTWGQEHNPSLLKYVSAREIVESGYWSFAIVRDPYTRIESCWRNKCFKGWKPSLINWGVQKGMSFEDFVEVVCSTPDEDSYDFGQHWRSQVWDLSVDGEIVADFLGKYEAINEAWETVRRHSCVHLPELGHVNQSEPHEAQWTQSLRDMVADRYAQDFERLGYAP